MPYYKSQGPLYITLSYTNANDIILNLFVKYKNSKNSKNKHNFYLNLRNEKIKDQINLIENGLCPNCKNYLWFSSEDKYNLIYCKVCNYEAWSDKIYYTWDFDEF